MQKLELYHVSGNAFDRIGRQWMLITVRAGERVNAMTASWGGLGEMWNQRAAFVFVRPQRYTFELMEAADSFSLCFMPEAYRSVHKIMGSKSGRDMDKIAATELTVNDHEGFPYFTQAELVLCCRKLYGADLQKEGFVDPELIDKNYPEADFHRMYVGGVALALTP